MRYCVLGSGSNGNSCYVEEGETRILVDVGLGPRILAKRLSVLGTTIQDLTHVFLTHEHWDHIRGLDSLLKRNPNLEVWGTQKTLNCLKLQSPAPMRPLRKKRALSLGPLTVFPFPTSHDCADSVGYRMESPGGRLGIATDLGTFNEATVDALMGLQGVVLEANHCPNLLESGPYPFFLKKRIAGKHGHLSNTQCRDLLKRILGPTLKHVTFAHMSDKNNSQDALWKAISPLFRGTSPPKNWTLGSRKQALAPVELASQLSLFT